MSGEQQSLSMGDIPFAFQGISYEARNTIQPGDLPERMPLEAYIGQTLQRLPDLNAHLDDLPLESYAAQLFSEQEKLSLMTLTRLCTRQNAGIVSDLLKLSSSSIRGTTTSRRQTIHATIGAVLSAFAAIPWLHFEVFAPRREGPRPAKLIIPDLLRLPSIKQERTVHILGSTTLAYLEIGIRHRYTLLEDCAPGLKTPSRSIFTRTISELQGAINEARQPPRLVMRFFQTPNRASPSNAEKDSVDPGSQEPPASDRERESRRYRQRLNALRASPEIKLEARDLMPGDPPLLLRGDAVAYDGLNRLIAAHADLILCTMYETHYQDQTNPPPPQSPGPRVIRKPGGSCAQLHLYVPDFNDEEIAALVKPIKLNDNIVSAKRLLFVYKSKSIWPPRLEIRQIDVALKEYKDEDGNPLYVGLSRRHTELTSRQQTGLRNHLLPLVGGIMPDKEN